MISSEIAGLAVSVAAGVIKLGRRVDQIMAEEVALRSDTSLPFPPVAVVPGIPKLKRRLRELLKETAGQEPDPLAKDREKIKTAIQHGSREDLERWCAAYQLSDFGYTQFDPDQEFKRALLARNAAWNLSDADILKLTYFVAAGADHRQSSLGFRLAATTVDVLAEVAAQNTQFLVRDPAARQVLQTVLVKFSLPDLASMPGWSALLKQALRATINGVIDARETLEANRPWLELILGSLAQARTLSAQGDDFVMGLLEGRGVRHLIRGALQTGATALADDPGVGQAILRDVLTAAAQHMEDASGFDEFFRDNWHSLIAAALHSVAQQGPRLLQGEKPVVQKTLVAAVNALAGSMQQGPPTRETLEAVLSAAIGVFAEDPEALEGTVAEDWLRELIQSVAQVLNSNQVGLRQAFSREAMEGYLRATLTTFSRHPDVLVADSALVQSLLRNVLGAMAKTETLALDELGNAAIVGGLQAINENPDLLNTRYSELLGELAGRIAQRVKARTITRLQAKDLIAAAAETLANNEQLFLKAQTKLAGALLDVVADAAGNDARKLLAGQALTITARKIMQIFAARGEKLLAGTSLDALKTTLDQVLVGTLKQVEANLGRSIDRRHVPAVLAGIVEEWSRGQLPDPSDSHQLRALFEPLAEKLIQSTVQESLV